ncbi:MAG: GNAT family N-acetyltransferase [Jhaorihella sp.]
MKQTAKIRQYKPADTDTVIAVWEAANAQAHPFLPEDFVDTVRTDMRNIYLPNAETWVVDLDGETVGFIAMIGTEIGGLFVDPQHHGKGLGRALVDTVVADRGLLQVEVFANNSIGRRFYDGYGFARVNEYLHEPSGQITIRMEMPASSSAAH